MEGHPTEVTSRPYGHPPEGYTDAERATWRHRFTLDEMAGSWWGEDCVVVGGGPSAAEAIRWQLFHREYWTIGCNRAAVYNVDIAACFEPRKDWPLWDAIKHTPALVLSHIPRDHPRVILTPGKQDIRDACGGPPAFGQSVYFATYCALVLGFETVGVIGLDLTPDRYRVPDVRLSNGAYRSLREFAEGRGQRVINLSRKSRVKALTAGGWEEVRRK